MCFLFFGFLSRQKYKTEGYAKNLAGDRCLPVCTECINGKCIAPGECKCNPGYGGPACDISECARKKITFSIANFHVLLNSVCFFIYDSFRLSNWCLGT